MLQSSTAMVFTTKLILFSRIFQSQHQKVNRSKGSASVLVQVNPLQTGKAKSAEKYLLNSSWHQDPYTVSVHSPDNPGPNEGLPMVFEKNSSNVSQQCIATY